MKHPDNWTNHIRIEPLIFSILLILFFFPLGSVAALTPEFVPEGLSLVSLKITQSSYDEFFTKGSETASVLDVYKDRNDVDSDAVSGSVSYDSNILTLSYQYGVFKDFNLGVELPYLKQQRKSDINLNDTGQASFAESLDSADSAGVGDLEIFALYRLFYSDMADLQIGLTLNGNNGNYYGDEIDKLPLGSGSNEMSLFLRWFFYPIQSRLTISIEFECSIVEDSTVKISSDQDVIREMGNSAYAWVDVSTQSGAIEYGGGLKAALIGTEKLDGVSQENGYMGYGLRGFVSFGNLHLLENQVINLPWELVFTAEKTVAGNNAPNDQTFSLKLMTYF